MIAYLEALRTYLLTQPPPPGGLGIVHVGSFKDDPTRVTPVITLHLGNPLDQNQPYVERIERMFRHEQVDSPFVVFGGVREIGGGEYVWHHFSAYVRYFLTGLTQDQAAKRNQDLVYWLERQIIRAQPGSVLTFDDGSATYEEIVLERTNVFETGGPPASWIWNSLIAFKALVYTTREV